MLQGQAAAAAAAAVDKWNWFDRHAAVVPSSDVSTGNEGK